MYIFFTRSLSAGAQETHIPLPLPSKKKRRALMVFLFSLRHDALEYDIQSSRH